jgi:hypothetical protein
MYTYSGDEYQNGQNESLLSFFESADNMNIVDSGNEYQDNSSVDTSSGGFNTYTNQVFNIEIVYVHRNSICRYEYMYSYIFTYKDV